MCRDSISAGRYLIAGTRNMVTRTRLHLLEIASSGWRGHCGGIAAMRAWNGRSELLISRKREFSAVGARVIFGWSQRKQRITRITFSEKRWKPSRTAMGQCK
jgi:hypothetical protein